MERITTKWIRGAVLASAIALLSACGGGGGGGGGTNPPPADIKAEPFTFKPAEFNDVRPGDSVEGSATVSGFDGTLKATFTTQGPITATLRNGRSGKAAKSVELEAGDTLFALVSVNDDATSGKTFTLKLTVGDGDTAVSASLKGTVGDSSAPTVSVDFPSKSSIVTAPKTSITGRVTDNVGIESVRIKELPEVHVQLNDDGTWIFAGVPLTQGDNTFTVEATDVAGLVAEESLTVFRDTLWFEDPVAMHRLSDTQDLVLDNATDTLYEVNLKTGAQRAVTSPETAGSEGVPMRHPRDMAVDTVRNKAYVLNSGPQINGIISVDLATGERTILSNFHFDAMDENALAEVGNGDPWVAPTRISFHHFGTNNIANGRVYVVDSTALFTVSVTDGTRKLLKDYGVTVKDIHVGNFRTHVAGGVDGIVVLLKSSVGLYSLVTGNLLDANKPGVAANGEWLMPFAGEVGILDFVIPNGQPANYKITQYQPGVDEKTIDIVDPTDDYALENAVAATGELNGPVYVAMRGDRAGHLLEGRGPTGGYKPLLPEILPTGYPDLTTGRSFADLFNLTSSTARFLAFDQVQRKAYVATGQGTEFVLLQLDPQTGERKRLLHGLDDTKLNLMAGKRFVAHDGIVYLYTNANTPDEKDGIYAVDTASCTDSSGLMECVDAFFLESADDIQADEAVIPNWPDMMAVNGNELVLVARGYLDATDSHVDKLLRFDRNTGALVSEIQFEETDNSSSALLDDAVYTRKFGTKSIQKAAVNTPDGSILTLISQCDDRTTVFSLTCDETSRINPKGQGPAIGELKGIYPGAHGNLVVHMNARVPSAFDSSVLALTSKRSGYYLVDVESGDRMFIHGEDPFDGNARGGDADTIGTMDVEGERMLRFRSHQEVVEAINYRQATDIATGKTYYPADRAIIAH